MVKTIGRPETNEYAEDYGKYVKLVEGDDVLAELGRQLESTLSMFQNISEARAGYRYAPDKWSIKEVLGHLIDAERIFAYRALRFSRNDQTPIEGFEQDDYVKNAAFDAFPFSELLDEFKSTRHSTISLFKHLEPAAWHRKGKASENDVTVRALAYIIAGHELHHRNVLHSQYGV